MRTAVTLEKDVELLLREAMQRDGKSFKETVNAALRAGLEEEAGKKMGRKFVVKARSMGFRAGINPAGFQQTGR